MLESISPMMWEEWKVFARRWPFGDRRADLRNALLAVAIDVVMAKSTMSGTVLDPKTLLPFDVDQDESSGGCEDPALQMMKLELLAQRFNGK